MSALLIYAAVGYTRSMVARQAKAAGLDFIIAGRDATKLEMLARELDSPYRAFHIDADEADRNLQGISVLLNCAGPFVRTAEPRMRASIKTGVHYLDITAEINVESFLRSFEALRSGDGSRSSANWRRIASRLFRASLDEIWGYTPRERDFSFVACQ